MLGLKLTFKANGKFPLIARNAIKKSLESAALPLEKATKELITREQHIVTGRYRASINYNVNDGQSRDRSSASKPDDGIHNFKNSDMTLEAGTNVEYAASLEKRYSLLARGKEIAFKYMISDFDKTLKRLLK